MGFRVYIGSKKANLHPLKGVTIFKSDGSVVFSDVAILRDVADNKFDRVLKTLLWGIKKVKMLGQHNIIDEQSDIFLFIDSKTVYTWFEKGAAPVPYIDIFADVLFELSLVRNQIEIIYSQNSRVSYEKHNTTDEYVKITDLYKSL